MTEPMTRAGFAAVIGAPNAGKSTLVNRLVGAKVTITDTRSGFKASPTFPPGYEPIAMQVPGGPIPRTIHLDLAEGAIFYGLQTSDPQMIDNNFRFDWSQLPEPA